MKLCDIDIQSRLTDLKQLGIENPADCILDKIKKGNIPDYIDYALNEGKIIIDPMPDLEVALGSSTIDLRLGHIIECAKIPLQVITEIHADGRTEEIIRVARCDLRDFSEIKTLENCNGVIDFGQTKKRFCLSENQVFELPPNMQVNMMTHEVIFIPYDLEVTIDGRSRLAREGVTTHITSSRFDAGFTGRAVLEISKNGLNSILLAPGERIASIGFHQLSQKVKTPYLKKNNPSFSGQH